MNNNRNERRKTNIVSLHSAINNESFGFHNNDLNEIYMHFKEIRSKRWKTHFWLSYFWLNKMLILNYIEIIHKRISRTALLPIHFFNFSAQYFIYLWFSVIIETRPIKWNFWKQPVHSYENNCNFSQGKILLNCCNNCFFSIKMKCQHVHIRIYILYSI